MSQKLPMTLACDLYDRAAPLYDGRVEPEGIALNYLPLPPVETLWRQLKYAEFEASEMSLSAYIIEVSRGEPRFVGLPVFIARVFRRAYIFVREDSGIETPEDLKGKRVGVPEYHMTAALFMRGLLSDDYGVKAEDIQWFQGGQHEAGRKERIELSLPESISVTHVPDRSLDEMLASGDLDAVASGLSPLRVEDGGPPVRRLFADPRADDLEAFRRSGVSPIMHLIAVRRDVYERSPWAAMSLYKAFERAKDLVTDQLLSYRGQAAISLPFIELAVEQALKDFGRDFYPYGVEANRATLEAAVRYSHEQGLSARRVSVDELFPANLERSRD